MSAVLRIALEEWRLWLRSRIVVAAALIIAVLLAATAALTIDRLTTQQAQRADQQVSAEQAFFSQPDRHPHRMVHYGHYAFRLPPPLAVFDPGVDAVTGQSIFLEGHRQNTAMFADAKASANTGGFTALTPANLYQVLLPLLIIIIGHGVILRERESPMAPAEVEEELAWISAALHHSIYESQWRIPAFSAWSEARDAAPIYREFKRMFQTDAAVRGNAAKPRVLKVPAFAEDLDTLLALFPDARLVLASRASEAVLKSAVSLSANQMAVQSDTCDLAAIEALWRHKIALREDQVAAALADWRGPVARLAFDDLTADWESSIAQCYRDLGLALTPEALARMRRVMAASARGAHHAHAAQLAGFASSEP